MHLFTQSIVVLWKNMISGSPVFNVWLNASAETKWRGNIHPTSTLLGFAPH